MNDLCFAGWLFPPASAAFLMVVLLSRSLLLAILHGHLLHSNLLHFLLEVGTIGSWIALPRRAEISGIGCFRHGEMCQTLGCAHLSTLALCLSRLSWSPGLAGILRAALAGSLQLCAHWLRALGVLSSLVTQCLAWSSLCSW